MNDTDHLSPDDQTRIEGRLSGWKPTTSSSSKERMLFESGVAAGRAEARSRWMLLLLALAIGLGGWAVHERAGRRTLELALAERAGALELALTRPTLPRKSLPGPTIELSPTTYLAIARRLAISRPDEAGTVPQTSAPGQYPASLGLTFTPLSSRQIEHLAEL